MSFVTETLNQLSAAEQQDLLLFLKQFVTPERAALIETALPQRTRHLTVVLENIYQPHNASAVLRTADCFGIQDIHLIESQNEYRINKDIALGASQWLTLRRYGHAEQGSTAACLTQLKQQGYRIAATTLRPGSVSLPDVDVSQPVAICFGTEEEGLSEKAHELADFFVTIPMSGFTQSFNISVSAGIVLYQLTQKMRRDTADWPLSPDEQRLLHIRWLASSATRPEALLRHFLRDRGVEF